MARPSLRVRRGAPPRRSASATRISRLLGDDVSGTEIARLLTGIGFTVRAIDDDRLEITPPTWRTDVARDADIVEEVARLRGYDVLSDELRAVRDAETEHGLDPAQRVCMRLDL